MWVRLETNFSSDSNQHYSSIRNKLEIPVSRYFQGHNCTEPYPVRIFILPQMKDTDNAQDLRNKWEESERLG